MKKSIFFIFLLAFLIRLINLNQSLWLDEATTANVVKNFSFFDIVTKFSPNDFHPPLYYLFLKLWTNIFGYTEVALRMPSVIFSLLTGCVIYRIAKLLNGQIVGMYAVAFFLFNPLIVYYSQEARMYMMSTFLLSLFLYVLIKFKIQNSKFKNATQNLKLLLIINGCIVLSLFTFYGSVFFIAAMYLYLLFKKEFKLLTLILPGSILAGLILFPLFQKQIMHSGIVLQEVKNWSPVLGKAEVKNLLLFPIKFTSGRISWEPKMVYYLVSGLWTILISYFVILNLFQNLKKMPKQVRHDIITFIFLLIAPIVFGFVVSFYKPLLQYFRFLYLIVPLSIILAIIIQKNWQRYIITSGFLIFSLLYLLFPQYHREDWKSLVTDLSQSTNTIYMIPS
ncbi:MAG: glycosyltransferase family 39 protein, partial [Patescibacteria group bacterium]